MSDTERTPRETPQLGTDLEVAPETGWRKVELEVPDTRASQRRYSVSIPVSVTTIDPVRDRGTGELYYDSADGQEVLNVSRRGACLRCERPPAEGTRLLLRLRMPGADRDVDVIGRARWTQVEYIGGEHGGRAMARVGLELIGGRPDALDCYDRSIQELTRSETSPLAAPEALG